MRHQFGKRGKAKKRWGVVLAGGDGVRLRPLTRLISGDERPKQFCALYGDLTLLEQARRRAERSIPRRQILFSLCRAHESFYLPLLSDCASQRVVQPLNRGTAPAIMSALLPIARQNADARAAIFPSDHHYSDEDIVTSAVEEAFALVDREPDSLILLGARPHAAEVEYGWIETGEPLEGAADSFRVRSFHEKPSEELARLLWERQSLWNTFVMVGRVFTFLEMICSATPGLLRSFRERPILRVPDREIRLEDTLYARIPHVDFSRQVLSLEPSRLIVHRMGPVVWNDLGDCNRAVAALSRSGLEPEWARHWRSSPVGATAVA
ncbi:MAG TPA: sugar phosphate nucleotidyltransferase [Bryobacteraceae bacterium]